MAAAGFDEPGFLTSGRAYLNGLLATHARPLRPGEGLGGPCCQLAAAEYLLPDGTKACRACAKLRLPALLGVAT